MRSVLGLATLVGLFLVGCAETKTAPTGGPARSVVTLDQAPADPVDPTIADPAATVVASDQGVPLATPVAIADDTVTLTPENTRIVFVGTHAGDKPDPRTGGFEKFSGKLQVDPATKSLKSVSLEIDANSVWTEFQKLTDHLRSPDFFEVREHPTIRFESTRIQGRDGQCQITGMLTLHGETKEITVPATLQIGEQGATLKSTFSINRSEFAMKKMDNVVDKVSLTVVVGEKTQPRRP